MVPSEAEIEARLAELRRRREAIDREIADHLLYLELGRRLRAGTAAEGSRPDPASATFPWCKAVSSRSNLPVSPPRSVGA